MARVFVRSSSRRFFGGFSLPAIAVVALMTLSAAPSPLLAQVLYGSLVGNVTDGTGAAVPGATVNIKHVETGATHDAVTDTTGAYRFPTVQPGTYVVTVQLAGFRTFTREHVP